VPIGLTFGARATKLALAAVGASSLGACAARSVYEGIPLDKGAAEPGLQDLAKRAKAGNRQARLELGKRFEDGRGVVRDVQRACAIFTRTPSGTARETWVYTPSTGAMEQYTRPGKANFAPDELALRAYRCREAQLRGSLP
jgi:TPR repeat protein